MNRHILLGVDFAAPVNFVADNIDNASQKFRSDRNRNRLSRIVNFNAAAHAVRGIHRNRADDIFAEVLLYFQHQAPPADFAFQRA